MDRHFSSLYVHVPFCAAKCHYCDFYSVPAPDTAARKAYLERLRAEFRENARFCTGLDSAFLGGGTPSCLQPEELTELLAAIHESFTFSEAAEFTCECNPESPSERKIEILAGAGVNRVSLGIQTFNDKHRQTLGRQGDLSNLRTAVAALRHCCVQNINFDLINAIPGQTLAEWTSDLQQACDWGVGHLSTYALTLAEGSRLSRSGLTPAGPDVAAQMWEHTDTLVRSAGLERYEVSNLAKPGLECRHNLDVWHGGTYLGCGPSAASFDGCSRWTNPGTIGQWLNRAPRLEDRLAPEARAAEILAFGCRTARGWTRAQFHARTGFDFMAIRGEAIADLVGDELLHTADDVLRPTRKGLLFADLIAERLL